MAREPAKAERIFSMLPVTGVLKMLLFAAPRQLTVLAYHRVEDASQPGFDTFKPNVSATPVAFRQQMEFVKRHYHVIRGADLVGWLRGECELPPRAALITFDDGYIDNLTHAYPVLRDFGLPATIFLCTGHIGTGVPFYWDYTAYCFAHSEKHNAAVPLLGAVAWSDMPGRDHAVHAWVERAKRLGEDERREALHGLARVLDVRVPQDAFSGLYLNWEQVRQLSANGIDFGAHTVSHPILSAVSPELARQEIAESKEKVDAEIGKPVISFAYPNGGRGDFSTQVIEILHGAGFQVAYTLMPGPTRYSTVKAQPLAVRRTFIGRADTLARFAAKLAGAARLRQGSDY